MRLSRLPFLRRLIPSWRKRVALLQPRHRYRIVKRNGAHFVVNFANWADRMVVAHGLVERDQIDFFLGEIRRRHCSVFLDVGANMGLYSIFVAQQTECAKIIAFEPDQRSYAQLQANLLLNDLLEIVESRAVAVSDRDGRVPFEWGPATHNVWSKISQDAAAATHFVAAVRLDDAISLSGQIIAIKIDIEGHELKALQGMENLLRNNQCLMQVECFDNNLAPVRGAMELVGYKLVHQIGVDRYFAN